LIYYLNSWGRPDLNIYLEDFQMQKKYDLIVYIGRFQPPHLAHIKTIEYAKEMATSVLVLIGSANQPRTIKNPWTWQERKEMIFASIEPTARQPVMIAPLRDIMYNGLAWLEQVQEVVMNYSSEGDKIAIIGHSKDETSFYLKSFPQWATVDVELIEDLHATDIRTAMFESEDFSEEMGNKIPQGIHDFIKSFMLRPEYENLVNEYKFQEYHDRMWDMDKMFDYFINQELENSSAWKGNELVVQTVIKTLRENYRVAPYAPYFNCVDCLVVQSGHVLLIRRRAEPGKNLYAIPGGYLNHKEWSVDGALRELKEETKIKVPLPVLRGNIKADHTFEHPERSFRGRVITRCYIIVLPDGQLPKVKASDDADRSPWVPLSVFKQMEDQMFEDHWHLVNVMLNLI